LAILFFSSLLLIENLQTCFFKDLLLVLIFENLEKNTGIKHNAKSVPSTFQGNSSKHEGS
jgi:hypothetical protein